MKKRILVDAYCNDNIGDDLFLKILFERYSEVDFTILNAKTNYKKKFKQKIKILNTNRLKKFLFNLIPSIFLRKYDGMVLIGGSMFIEDGNWRNLYQKRKKLFNNFFVTDRPVFILGSNFGPYDSNEFYQAYDLIFKQCFDVSFRDSYSYEKFSHLKNVRWAPDIVFNLKSSSSTIKEKNVGISLIDLDKRIELRDYSQVYLVKIKELIKKYLDNNFDVYLFSFCEKEGDLNIISRILKSFGTINKNIHVVNYQDNIESFLEEFKKMNIIIGCRFHSVILSQIYNQNVYPLIYSNKTMNVLKDLSLSTYYKEISNIDTLDSNQVFEATHNNKIKDRKFFTKSQDHFIYLDSIIRGV